MQKKSRRNEKCIWTHGMQLLTKASRKRLRNRKSQMNTKIHRPVLIDFNESKRTRKGCSRERPRDIIIINHLGRDEGCMGAKETTDDVKSSRQSQWKFANTYLIFTKMLHVTISKSPHRFKSRSCELENYNIDGQKFKCNAAGVY